MALTITMLTAAICGIMLLATAMDTVRHRMRLRAPFGMADDPKLTAASRAHANLAEHAPLALIMLGLLELSHAWNNGLKLVAAAFLLARIAHIFGIYGSTERGVPVARQVGVTGTWLVYAVLILWTLYTVVQLHR